MTIAKQKPNLLWFNLKTDAADDVLGFTTQWLNTLAPHFNHIDVITTQKGKLELAPNIQVYSLGKELGHSKIKRFFNFYLSLFKIFKSRRIHACFSHMNQRFVILAGPFLKIKKIPIVLWYAHGKTSVDLKIATGFCQKVVTSSQGGFKLKTNKKEIIGQGIDVNRFQPAGQADHQSSLKILMVSRISAIKKIETVVEALHLLPQAILKKIKVRVAGQPLTDEDKQYFSKISSLIESYQLQNYFEFIGKVSFQKIHSYYQESQLFINPGITGSVDKTVLEAMSCGSGVITCNEAFKDILPASFLKNSYFEKNDTQTLAKLIENFVAMPASEKNNLLTAQRNWVIENHSLTSLGEKLKNVLYTLIGQSQNA